MLVFFSLYYPVFNGYMRRRGTKLERQNQSPYSPSKKSLYFLLWKTSYNKTLIERYQIQKQFFFTFLQIFLRKYCYGILVYVIFFTKVDVTKYYKTTNFKGERKKFFKKTVNLLLMQ